jgi:D-arabinose 1-dehydrogenase-like Zn-dependent alcohol dehydrogenase
VAQYCILRSEAVVQLPRGLDPEQAAPLLCAGVTVFNAIRHQRARPGDVVAVQGIGGLGHLAIQFAVKMGFRVVAISRGDSKRKDALQLGAHYYVDSSTTDVVAELKSLGGASLVVSTAPDPTIIGQYAACLKWQGTLLVLARKSFTAFTPFLFHFGRRLIGC